MQINTALELAIMEDKYGTTDTNTMLESEEYQEDFKQWIAHMESENSYTFEDY